MRRTFADCLYKEMKKNKDIYLLCMDLGYKIFDKHLSDFKDRCIVLPASEQAGLGVAVGLALSGKIPFIYTITPFLLYRPFEWLRNYLHHEKIAVKLAASGRNKEYLVDGFTHWSEEAKQVLNCLPNIKQLWPEDKKQIPYLVNKMINNNKSTFISLKRR